MSTLFENNIDMPNNNRLQPIWAGLARNDRWSRFIHEEDVHTFSRRMESEGPEFYARGLHALRSACLAGLETGKIGDLGRFGLKRGSDYLPRFLYGAFAAIFDKDTGEVRRDVDVDAVACVNQLTAVFTKLKGGHTPQSEQTVIDSFIKTEEEIHSTVIDETTTVHTFNDSCGQILVGKEPLEWVLNRASGLVKRVLSGSDPREIHPSHGSGVSACGTPIRSRYATPNYVPKIDAIWPMHSYYFATPTAFCDKLDEYLSMPVVDPCARVLLVPKDARGPRLISCEPKETMWIQQGLMSRLYRDIQEHPLTKDRVNFTHQWFNQLAARDGSYAAMRTKHLCEQTEHAEYLRRVAESMLKDELPNLLDWDLSDVVQTYEDQICASYEKMMNLSHADALFPDHPLQGDWGSRVALATLDLKDASDRLRLDVVQRIFPTNWADALTACRSEMTELPDGRLVTMRKHAPMGSAVCFPVMALTIWSLLTAIAPRCASKHILVYGDDIIVPTYLVQSAIEVLEAVGLMVNRSKSFARGLFRESCGEEYFGGVRITPVRLRQYPTDDVESMMSCMAFNNNMLENPYLRHNTGWYIDLLHGWYGKRNIPVLLYVPNSPKVGIWSERDKCLRIKCRTINSKSALSGVAYTTDVLRVCPPSGRDSRYNRQLNCRQYRIRVAVPSTVQYGTSDWCHVLRSLTLTGPTISELGSDPIHNRIRFKRQWISSNG